MGTGAAITDPALRARLLLDDDAFEEHFLELLGTVPARELTQEDFERGLRYPWSRPERSFVVRDGTATALHELGRAERASALRRFLDPAAGRVPLLSFGANAAPRNLAIKLTSQPEPEDREALVLLGELRDLDVVAAAGVTIYGAMPGTLTASPGTAVRVAVMLVTGVQLTTLTWTEISYRIGLLADHVVTLEDGLEGVELDAPLAYVNRFGAFAPDGRPIALAAVPARGRRFRAWTQRELLQRAAALLFGADGTAQELVALRAADPAGTARSGRPVLAAHALPAELPGWVPMAPDGTFPR